MPKQMADAKHLMTRNLKLSRACCGGADMDCAPVGLLRDGLHGERQARSGYPLHLSGGRYRLKRFATRNGHERGAEQQLGRGGRAPG